MRRSLQFGLMVLVTAALLPAAELANLRNGFNLRHEHHENLGDTTRLYLSTGPTSSYVDVRTADIESYEPAPLDVAQANPTAATTQDLSSIINSASARSQIDADFIASVIRAESADNPRAVSRKGARGLMQLMPYTASTLGVKDSFDPAENVDGGVRYLRELLVRYNGDVAKALAAYNAGPQRVQQYKGVPPYRETHAYVARIISDYNRKKLAQRKQQAATAKASAPSGKVAAMARTPQADSTGSD